MTDCLKYFISNQEPLLRTWQQNCLDVFFILRNFTAKQKVNSLFFSISHGLGFSTSCWETFWQVLVHFRATFSDFVSTNLLHSEQFLQLSSNSQISGQLLVLKLAFLPYFTMFQQTIYDFPVKKEPNPSPWGRSWAKQQQQQQQHLFKHDKNYSGADVVVYLKIKHSSQMNKKLEI